VRSATGLCLARIKSAFEMNNIQRAHVTCYMEDISLLRSFGEGQALVHVEAEHVLIAQSAKKTHSRDSQNCLLAETVGIVAAVEIDQ
jgi:hypothetical protein